jgi:transcriptional regulator with XRE-family HTH domain
MPKDNYRDVIPTKISFNKSVLGKTLRHVRTRKKMTVMKLAMVSGVSHSQINNIEKGKTNPTIQTIVQLSEALELQPGFLLLCGVSYTGGVSLGS